MNRRLYDKRALVQGTPRIRTLYSEVARHILSPNFVKRNRNISNGVIKNLRCRESRALKTYVISDTEVIKMKNKCIAE